MIKWKTYFNRIPAHIKIGKNNYEILWTEEFKHDDTQLGESRFGQVRQIIINKNQSIKEAVHTYWHEVIHAISEEYGVNMTEKQVIAFEKGLKHVFDLFKKDEVRAKYKRKKK